MGGVVYRRYPRIDGFSCRSVPPISSVEVCLLALSFRHRNCEGRFGGLHWLPNCNDGISRPSEENNDHYFHELAGPPCFGSTASHHDTVTRRLLWMVSSLALANVLFIEGQKARYLDAALSSTDLSQLYA